MFRTIKVSIYSLIINTFEQTKWKSGYNKGGRKIAFQTVHVHYLEGSKVRAHLLAIYAPTMTISTRNDVSDEAKLLLGTEMHYRNAYAVLGPSSTHQFPVP